MSIPKDSEILFDNAALDEADRLEDSYHKRLESEAISVAVERGYEGDELVVYARDFIEAASRLATVPDHLEKKPVDHPMSETPPVDTQLLVWYPPSCVDAGTWATAIYRDGKWYEHAESNRKHDPGYIFCWRLAPPAPAEIPRSSLDWSKPLRTVGGGDVKVEFVSITAGSPTFTRRCRLTYGQWVTEEFYTEDGYFDDGAISHPWNLVNVAD